MNKHNDNMYVVNMTIIYKKVYYVTRVSNRHRLTSTQVISGPLTGVVKEMDSLVYKIKYFHSNENEMTPFSNNSKHVSFVNGKNCKEKKNFKTK